MASLAAGIVPVLETSETFGSLTAAGLALRDLKRKNPPTLPTIKINATTPPITSDFEPRGEGGADSQAAVDEAIGNDVWPPVRESVGPSVRTTVGAGGLLTGGFGTTAIGTKSDRPIPAVAKASFNSVANWPAVACRSLRSFEDRKSVV